MINKPFSLCSLSTVVVQLICNEQVIRSNRIGSSIFICREYLHTAVKTYAEDPSEETKVSTKWPFRDSAKMLSYTRGV